MPDIAGAQRAEDGIGQGVDQHVGVGMAFEALVVGQLNAPEKKFADPPPEDGRRNRCQRDS